MVLPVLVSVRLRLAVELNTTTSFGYCFSATDLVFHYQIHLASTAPVLLTSHPHACAGGAEPFDLLHSPRYAPIREEGGRKYLIRGWCM